MEKKPITEANAAAAVMDLVFSQVEERWSQVSDPLVRIVGEAGLPAIKQDFSRFNFSLAALAINFRVVFDLVPRDQAERIFTHMLQFLERQLGSGPGFTAVRNAVMKYIEAYNNGIIAIRNPVYDVGMLLYYKIGLENTRQRVVDEVYFIPEPRIVDYLTHALSMFLSKWDYLLERYQLQSPEGQVPSM
jgi:hypothetical protein